jgi:hypothetical protein
MFSFVGTCQDVFQSAVSLYIPTGNEREVLLLILPIFGVVSVLDFSHAISLLF